MVRSHERYRMEVRGSGGSTRPSISHGPAQSPSSSASLPQAPTVQPVVSSPGTAVAVPKGQLKTDFIIALKVNNLSERTIEAYGNAVSMFQGFPRRDPLDVNVNDIRAFFFI